MQIFVVGNTNRPESSFICTSLRVLCIAWVTTESIGSIDHTSEFCSIGTIIHVQIICFYIFYLLFGRFALSLTAPATVCSVQIYFHKEFVGYSFLYIYFNSTVNKTYQRQFYMFIFLY